MLILSALLVWLLPLAGLITLFLWQAQKEFSAVDSEIEIEADSEPDSSAILHKLVQRGLEQIPSRPFVSALLAFQLLLWFVPTGIWVGLLVLILYCAAKKLQPLRAGLVDNAALLALLLVFHLLLASFPVSSPAGPSEWGEPISTENEEAALWPATTQHVWVRPDGQILIVTHGRLPGILNPAGAAELTHAWVAGSAAEEQRLEQGLERLPGWVPTSKFSLRQVGGEQEHTYGGESLPVSRSEVLLQLPVLGETEVAELLTVYYGAWGGEVQLLTIIRPGVDSFDSDSWAEEEVSAWLNG